MWSRKRFLKRSDEILNPTSIQRVLVLIARVLIRPYASKRIPDKNVAIVVPGYSRKELTEDERLSLRQLTKVLGRYDKYCVSPRGGLALEGFGTAEFDHRYFGSATAYGRLLGSAEFYRRFVRYRYILIYHLDALVFRDELMEWCTSRWDYIGAPWIPCADYPWVPEPKVGNGGFTLMKVDSALKVLYNRYRDKPGEILVERLPWIVWLLQTGLRVLQPGERRRHMRGRNRSRLASIRRLEGLARDAKNNDLFWSNDAARFNPEFRIADWRTALRFAFEGAPRLCFELNGRSLPFGCHAWGRYDREFWGTHLLEASV